MQIRIWDINDEMNKVRLEILLLQFDGNMLNSALETSNITTFIVLNLGSKV